MNYLQLCQRLRSECEIPGTGPAAVTSQTGQFLRLVNWISAAYKEIQNSKPNWRWLRRPFTFNTSAGDDSYAYTDVTDVDAGAPISRFSRWLANDPCDQYQAYLTSAGIAGQYWLTWLPWENFKYMYRHGPQNNNQPIHVSVDYQNNLVLGPKPNAIFTVTGDFQRSAQILAADGDTPEMPEQFHDLIWQWALEKYGANSVAVELFSRAQLECARNLSALELNQLPEITTGEPLV